MAEIDDSYQAKVGREQGGGRFYMKEDGEFKFFDVDWEGKSLRNFIGSFFDVAAYGASGSIVSGPEILSRYYGAYVFSLPTGVSVPSMHLPSAWKGARLVLDGTSMAGDANIIMLVSTGGGVAGVSLVARNGIALSSLNMSATAYAVLFCYTEGIWTVVEANTSAVERPT